MKLSNIILLALSAKFCSAVPPADFGLPTSEGNTTLSITYQSNGQPLQVQPGELFGIDIPAQQPTVAVNTSASTLGTNYTGLYMLMMVDPDASYPQTPTNRFIIHWWQMNLTRSTQASDTSDSIGGTRLVNSTAARVAYRRPAPPTNSSAHRYIQYLWEQPANFTVPAAFQGYNNTNNSKFNFTAFVQAAQLNNPVAANYFYCSNLTNLSSTFVASPGSQYPGGNGFAITSGPGPSVTPSATSSGASNSASGASASGSSSASASISSSTGSATTLKPGSNTMFGVFLAIVAFW